MLSKIVLDMKSKTIFVCQSVESMSDKGRKKNTLEAFYFSNQFLGGPHEESGL